MLTYRPRRLRVVAVGLSVALTVATAVGWLALPANLRATFTTFQILTLLSVLAFLVLVMLSLGTSYVRADADGLRFRNGLRTHSVGWARVHKILLRRGDPWALLLLKPADGGPFVADLDAEKRQLMGIQSGDGRHAEAALRELRALQRRHAG